MYFKIPMEETIRIPKILIPTLYLVEDRRGKDISPYTH